MVWSVLCVCVSVLQKRTMQHTEAVDVEIDVRIDVGIDVGTLRPSCCAGVDRVAIVVNVVWCDRFESQMEQPRATKEGTFIIMRPRFGGKVS